MYLVSYFMFQASRLIESRMGLAVGQVRLRHVLLELSELLDSQERAIKQLLSENESADALSAQALSIASSRQDPHRIRKLLHTLYQHWLPKFLERCNPRDEGDKKDFPPVCPRDVELALTAQAVVDACNTCSPAIDMSLHNNTTRTVPHSKPVGMVSHESRYPREQLKERGWSASPLPVFERSFRLPCGPVEVLRSICDGRLLPTPWLDEYGVKDAELSNLLQLEFKYAAPALTEEQEKFPEFFRVAIQEKEAHAAQLAKTRHIELQHLLQCCKQHQTSQEFMTQNSTGHE
ncbi:hypothetical protein CEUSTIGMA_g9442.t1 [Chlamydomonas eustigma]|uniref:Uncharacterized protein n=1 Tax=Chlamydomonas eustigma TaxID=1157962 RepID=A0A250XG10_9CHLO|nr:hypothetical protein CEUSTIGMA_g9442.t1 [Chlamydomonas eustigma]|eukprot:GAX82014.1 hypothetical protein CEUSTIGMA_g9442.t1 [Chlamydomonas eustigma]